MRPTIGNAAASASGIERRRRRQDVGGGDDVLGGRAVGDHREEGDDGVADRDVLDAVADGVDGSGDLDAGRVRQRHRERVLQVAAADATVDLVERRGGDAEADFAGTGGGLIDVLVAEDVRVAELVETNRLHLKPLFMRSVFDEADDSVRFTHRSGRQQRHDPLR